MSSNDVTREAEHQYAFDAKFHAAVHVAVEAVEADLITKTGNRMTSADRSLATLAACCALVVHEQGPLWRDKESGTDG